MGGGAWEGPRAGSTPSSSYPRLYRCAGPVGSRSQAGRAGAWDSGAWGWGGCCTMTSLGDRGTATMGPLPPR